MGKEKSITTLSDEFYRGFVSNAVVLYIGQNVGDVENLDIVAGCDWSCVVTTLRDETFGPRFAECVSRTDMTRHCMEFNSLSEFKDRQYSQKLFDKEMLPVFRLFGTEGKDEEDEDEEDLKSLRQTTNAKEILEYLIRQLQCRPMHIAAFNSEEDWALLSLSREIFQKEAWDGTVSVWGMPSEEDTPENRRRTRASLEQIWEGKRFSVSKHSLTDVIQTRRQEWVDSLDDESDAPLYEFESDTDFYHQAEKSLPISGRDSLLFKNFGVLLTEKEMNKISINGKFQHQRYFFRFLENFLEKNPNERRRETPRWYGYRRNSLYYVKRDFEDGLAHLVLKLLKGETLDGKSLSGPVFLEGPPGSSKSVTLGSLAYRIFNMKINPVIFISGENPDYEQIDNAIQFLKDNAAKHNTSPRRILIVWDNSSYNSGDDARTKSLWRFLNNRGRSFVLVSSAYEEWNGDKDISYYRLRQMPDNSETFQPCERGEASVAVRQNHYSVIARRSMSETELRRFWNSVREYSGILNPVVNSAQHGSLSADIFECYYMLISLLREKMSVRLRDEHDVITPYVKKELSENLRKISLSESKNNRALYQAFLDAGYEPPEETEEVESNGIEQNLDRLNLCAAMFSRMKLTVPYDLARKILIGDIKDYELLTCGDENYVAYYVLFTDIIHRIPWLSYEQNENGDYVLRFRNSLEASIYLKHHDPDGKKQLDLLYDILDIYGKEYAYTQRYERDFTESLQKLIHLLGPNSKYEPFQNKFSDEYDSYQRFLQDLNVLIDAVANLLNKYGVPDVDAEFASIIVTFTREYYGTLGNCEDEDQTPQISDYEICIGKMLDALIHAENGLARIEKQIPIAYNVGERTHLRSQTSILTVETVLCNISLNNLLGGYRELCKSENVTPRDDLMGRRWDYNRILSELKPLIMRLPVDGYCYNALFKAFEQQYEKCADIEQKTRMLSEIADIVNLCGVYDAEMQSRGTNGRDELGKHIATYWDYSSNISVTLDDISRYLDGIVSPEEVKENPFFAYYDKMLAQQKATAIVFLCQKELKDELRPQKGAGIHDLRQTQWEKCRKVYDFMRLEKHYNCVSKDPSALGMLIRVTWMYFNRTVLTSSPEYQTTALDYMQWETLYEYCRNYSDSIGNTPQPMLNLLYALSEIQRKPDESLYYSKYSKARDILNRLSESNLLYYRMKTPFLICDKNGVPKKYAGKVEDVNVDSKGGFIRIIGNNLKARFLLSRLKLEGQTKPLPNMSLDNLELGIGFFGFSVRRESKQAEGEN